MLGLSRGTQDVLVAACGIFLVVECGVFTCGMWDLQLWHANSQLWRVGSSSPTRDGTWDPCPGSVESQPLDHQRSPCSWVVNGLPPCQQSVYGFDGICFIGCGSFLVHRAGSLQLYPPATSVTFLSPHFKIDSSSWATFTHCSDVCSCHFFLNHLILASVPTA